MHHEHPEPERNEGGTRGTTRAETRQGASAETTKQRTRRQRALSWGGAETAGDVVLVFGMGLIVRQVSLDEEDGMIRSPP